MHIFFMGQLGIPARHTNFPTDEKRVEQLATILSAENHTIDVACTAPYSPKNLNRLQNINLVHLPSFNPEKAGGWLFLTLCLRHIWKTQPDVVHMHGWKSAALVRLAALLSPESTYVWTISHLPSDRSFLRKLVIWQAKRVFDAIVSINRTIQYRLLVDFHLKTTYIPDGYTEPNIKDASPSYWGLRKGQYSTICLDNERDLSWLLKAYVKAKSNKKVVVFTKETSYTSRLKKRHPYLRILDVKNGRATYSLIRQAGTALFMNESGAVDPLLQAMDANTTIIALNKAIFEETLGTGGHVIKPKDHKSLSEIWSASIKNRKKQLALGNIAKKRAKTHFSMERIGEEYMSLYHYPLVKKVPVDSIIAQKQSIQAF